MSVTWRESTIQQLTKYVGRGKSPVYADRGGVPSINQACIQNGGIDLSRTKNVTSTHFASLSSERIAHEGDVLLNSTGTGTLGRVGYWDSPVDISFDSHVTLLRFTERNVGKFFYYWLGTHGAQRLIENYCVTGSTNQIELARQPLLQLRVRHPEQHDAQLKIVECIDSVESEIRTLEAVIAKQERVRAGLLQELLSRGIDGNGELRAGGDGEQLLKRETVPLRSMCRKITKGTTPSTIGGKYYERGIPYVRVESISINGEILSEKLLFIDASTHQLLSRSIIRSGDILFSIAGAIGRTAVVTDCFEMNCNQAVAIIRPDYNQIDSSFLRLWLSSGPIQRAVNDQVVQLAQANFSLAMLGEVQIPRLDKDEQIRIVTAIKNWDDVTSDAKKQLTKVKSIKTGLIRDLLSGRMSVEPLLANLPSKL